MASPARHAPPANLDDYNDATRQLWSDWMDFVFDLEINPQNYADKVDKNGLWTDPALLKLDPNSDMSMGKPDDWKARPVLNRFYNCLKPQNRPENPITPPGFPEWEGFPLTLNWGVYDGTDKKTGQPVKLLKQASDKWLNPASGDGNNVWWQADQFRMYQDEYLEWAVVRDDKNKITKITFTSEGPEYWQKLAENQPDDLVKLYQKFNPSAKITKDDLFDKDGKYNQYNAYNSVHPENGAIAHLIQPNSTLGAEVDIVAQATVGRPASSSGDPQKLCECAAYGEKKRASDPRIGFGANKAVNQSGLSISIHEPIGLYMRSFESNNISAPDGHDFNVVDCWHVIRGDKGDNAAVRVEFYVPEGKGFCVGDLIDNRNNGCNILYGSQVAQNIMIGVKVDGGKLPDGTSPPLVIDACFPRDSELKDYDAELYDVNEDYFYHFMQYKALERGMGDKASQPWQMWLQEFPILMKTERSDGGHNLDKIPKIKPLNRTANVGPYLR